MKFNVIFPNPPNVSTSTGFDCLVEGSDNAVTFFFSSICWARREAGKFVVTLRSIQILAFRFAVFEII